ncbi:hypothetical protein LDO31_11255 [Luteimonas sp. XNQY3]|nr:hypothetical protein [Luteimonas sp. XNQY3]MCD9006803.1 hypothetical protein [Luteimonas sp. XNQY3]
MAENLFTIPAHVAWPRFSHPAGRACGRANPLFSAVRQGDTEAAKQASSARMETAGAQAWLAEGRARLAACDRAATQAPEVERHQVLHPQELQRPAGRAALAH